MRKKMGVFGQFDHSGAYLEFLVKPWLKRVQYTHCRADYILTQFVLDRAS